MNSRKILRKERLRVELLFIVVCSLFVSCCYTTDRDCRLILASLVVHSDKFAFDPVTICAIVPICGVLKALVKFVACIVQSLLGKGGTTGRLEV